MTPDEALTAVLKQNPRGVIIITENADGSIGMATGPQMSLAVINLALDQAKQYIVTQTMTHGGPIKVPDAGVTTLDTPVEATRG